MYQLLLKHAVLDFRNVEVGIDKFTIRDKAEKLKSWAERHLFPTGLEYSIENGICTVKNRRRLETKPISELENSVKTLFNFGRTLRKSILEAGHEVKAISIGTYLSEDLENEALDENLIVFVARGQVDPIRIVIPREESISELEIIRIIQTAI